MSDSDMKRNRRITISTLDFIQHQAMAILISISDFTTGILDLEFIIELLDWHMENKEREREMFIVAAKGLGAT